MQQAAPHLTARDKKANETPNPAAVVVVFIPVLPLAALLDAAGE